MQRRPQLNPRRTILKRTFARELRAIPTDAERKLWTHLRAKRMAHLRFRRQQSIGPYIPNFYCSAAKLVVELDGGQHGEERNLVYDELRTRWLEARGYRVLRFTNEDVLKHIDDVLVFIGRAVRESECPLPEPADAGSTPPQGEG